MERPGRSDPECPDAIGPVLYNEKVTAALTWMQQHLPTFALLDKGINEDEQSCILMKDGNFYGMGYIRDKKPLSSLAVLQQHLEPYQDNDYIRNLVFKHATTFPEKCVAFG